MLIKFIILILFLAVFASAKIYYNDFKYYLRFNDGRTSVRPFLIDISSAHSFVLSSTIESEERWSFNSSASRSYRKLGRTYVAKHPYPLNSRAFSIYCELGQDDVIIMGKTKLNVKFALATKRISGSPARGLDGGWAAGRLGFGRKTIHEHSTLTEEIIKTWNEKVLCLKTRRDENGRQLASVAVGRDITNSTSIKIKTRSVENSDGLWQVPVEELTIGSTRISANSIITLTTTSDVVAFPVEYVDEIVKALGAKKESDDYYVPCDAKLPSLKFVINKTTLEIDSEELKVKNDDGKCELKIAVSYDKFFVLGPIILDHLGICLNYANNDITFFNPLLV